MAPRLSILIATLGRRKSSFDRLLKQLLPQVDKAGGQVEVIAYWNNGELSIGRIRQALLEAARGEYVCYIDDDDRIPDYYVAEILAALGKDYVGFEVQLFNDSILKPPVYHSIKYNVWYQDDKGYYRGVTHLNPIKRALAFKGDFGNTGAGEDVSWARQVLPFVKTENYIDRIMYYYHHSMTDTSFGGDHKNKNLQYDRLAVSNSSFRYHPDSKESTEGLSWREQ